MSGFTTSGILPPHASWAQASRSEPSRVGHANAATTLTVYAHFLEASDQSAADVMGDLVANPDASRPRSAATEGQSGPTISGQPTEAG